jgi:pimeloyl-ACP methyl ester carboxylesterase
MTNLHFPSITAFTKMLLAGIRLSAVSLACLALAACVSTPETPPEVAPQSKACPEGVPAGATCLRGQDSASSHYLIVMPAKWSGVLVVHAHGGPSLGAPKMSRNDEDIKRWAITVKEGHAWAGSVFRQGGFAVTTAAEDTERVRRIFIDHVAKPRKTILHGQSWGTMVATRTAELFPKSWDGILLTSGVVAGPTTYDFRLDLRALYQHLCNNHPRSTEPSYSLAIGLPTDSKMTNADLAQRANECLGTGTPAAQRTPEQSLKLKTIVDVLKIPLSSVLSHLSWGTFALQDVVSKNGGTSPFGNAGVKYSGSSDDAKLNASIPRFQADPKAVARFLADVDYAGRFSVPVISGHAIDDPTVMVEGQSVLRQKMVSSGKADQLVQVFVNSSEHSYWGDAHYPPLFDALLSWVEKDQKPTPNSIADRCKQRNSANTATCKFQTDYIAKPIESRIFPR